MDPTTPQRRWRLPALRLSIRALMAIIVVVGAGLWWVVKDANNQREAVRMVRSRGGNVSYDFQQVAPDGRWDFNLKQPVTSFLQKGLPSELFQKVTFVNLKGPSIDDEDLELIAKLRDLEYLDLGNSRVTDAGLARIRGLRRLKFLCLDGTRVTDAGLAQLEEMKNLQHLILDRTAISDAGLSHLASHPLMSYTFESTQVTTDGIESLKKTILDKKMSGK